MFDTVRCNEHGCGVKLDKTVAAKRREVVPGHTVPEGKAIYFCPVHVPAWELRRRNYCTGAESYFVSIEVSAYGTPLVPPPVPERPIRTSRKR